jgi:hypothetical protein
MLLVPDLDHRQHAIALQLVAKSGKIESLHQVFDVERGDAQGHDRKKPVGAALAFAPPLTCYR